MECAINELTSKTKNIVYSKIIYILLREQIKSEISGGKKYVEVAQKYILREIGGETTFGELEEILINLRGQEMLRFKVDGKLLKYKLLVNTLLKKYGV